MKFKDFSIRKKLIFLLMTVAFSVLILGGTVTIVYDLVTLKKELQSELLALTKIIIPNCVAALEFKMPEDAQDTLSVLKLEPNIEAACIYLNDNQKFATYYHSNKSFNLLSQPPSQGFHLQRSGLSFIQPIYSNGVKIGVLFIRSDFSKIRAHIHHLLIVSIGSTLFIIFFAYLISIRLHRIISDPVSHLVDTAGRITNMNDYSIRAHLPGNDELGRLSQSFNLMLDEIQKRDIALSNAKNDLEKSVDERTAELNQSNIKLRNEISEREKADKLLRNIAETVSGENYEKFFNSLVQHLVTELEVKYAFVSVLNNEEMNSVNTVAFCVDGLIQENFNYKLSGTPGENVLGEKLCIYEKDIRRQFPHDKMLKDMGIEGYCAIPLFASNKAILGLMGIMDVWPLKNDDRIISILQILSARASSEIERKKNETVIREEKERLAVTLQSIRDGVITTDIKGKIVLINKIAQELTDQTADEAIGRPVNDVLNLINGKTRVPYDDQVQKILKTKEIINLGQNVTLQNKYGIERSISHNGAPITDQNDNVIGVVLVLRDITLLKKAEDDKKILELQLLQSQKMETIGTLAGGIAHDFNNILVPIMGYADMSIRDLPDNDRNKMRMELIIKAGTRARELIKQILAFSRQEVLEKKPSSIQAIIRETLDLIRATIPANISIKDKLDGKFGMVMANATQIQQIVINLCTNAHHVMDKGGVITVKLENCKVNDHFILNHPQLGNNSTIKLTISDTGKGMKPEVVNRIFDPYFTTKGVGKGSGLGLAVVHGIVTSHNGTIMVDSIPGEGTVFSVYFPLADIDNDANDTMTTPSSKAGNEHIMIIDDEEDVVGLIEEMLTLMGYQTSSWTNVNEALETFKNQPEQFDLVITDQSMPDMTGLQFAKEILEIRPEMNIILMSGFSESLTKDNIQKFGIRAYVMKPVLSGELNAVIRMCMDRSPD